jgi:hypothetical protein
LGVAISKTEGYRLHKLVILGLIAATAMAAYRFGRVAYTYWSMQPTDFGVFLNGAMAVDAGQSPYDVEGLRQMEFGAYYKNPPLLAIALIPLARLGFTQAWHSWFMISLILYVAAFAVLARTESLGPRSPYFWLLALAFTLFQPTLDTLFGGQLEFLLLLLFIVCYWAIQRQTAASAAISGISIAIGSLLKLYPILFAPWLLLRRPKAVIWVVVGLVGLTLLSIAAAGWQPHVQFVTQVLPALRGVTADPQNQSYSGFFARLWVNGASVEGSRATVLPPAVASLATIVSILTYVLSLAVSLRARHPRHAFTVLLPSILLVTPDAWIHYETLLLLPLGIFLAGLTRRSRHIAWPLLLIAFVLLAYGNEDAVRFTTSGLIQSYKFFGVFLMWLVGMLWAWYEQPDVRKSACQAPTPEPSRE